MKHSNEELIKVDYNKLGLCLASLLEADRSNWDKFHEDFIRILAEYGYTYCLTIDEKKWLDDYLVDGENLCISVDDYSW